MAEITLTPAPVLGTNLSLGGNRIVERSDLALVSVAVPQGGEPALAKAIKSVWSLDMPDPRRASQLGDTWAIWTAPDQIFLMIPHDTPDADAHVRAKLKGTGYTTDQTDGWVILDIEGPDTSAALERICPIDLDPGVFPTGASARTVMEHLGALILRLGEDRFLLMSARSSAASFLHAVETSYRNVAG